MISPAPTTRFARRWTSPHNASRRTLTSRSTRLRRDAQRSIDWRCANRRTGIGSGRSRSCTASLVTRQRRDRAATAHRRARCRVVASDRRSASGARRGGRSVRVAGSCIREARHRPGASADQPSPAVTPWRRAVECSREQDGLRAIAGLDSAGVVVLDFFFMRRSTDAGRYVLATVAALLTVVTPARAQTELSPAARKSVVDSTIAHITARYVDADTAKLIANAIRSRADAGAYDSVVNPARLADLITRDLRSVNRRSALFAPL